MLQTQLPLKTGKLHAMTAPGSIGPAHFLRGELARAPARHEHAHHPAVAVPVSETAKGLDPQVADFGHRPVVAISAEDDAGWLGFFRDLTARAISGVAPVTSNAGHRDGVTLPRRPGRGAERNSRGARWLPAPRTGDRGATLAEQLDERTEGLPCLHVNVQHFAQFAVPVLAGANIVCDSWAVQPYRAGSTLKGVTKRLLPY